MAQRAGEHVLPVVTVSLIPGPIPVQKTEALWEYPKPPLDDAFPPLPANVYFQRLDSIEVASANISFEADLFVS